VALPPLPDIDGLPPPLSLGLLSLGGGLFPDGGGLLLGGVFVGQFALASITDPSGHVFVVAAGGGVNVCVHDGSFGFVTHNCGLLAAGGHAAFVGSVLQFTGFGTRERITH
jgi:hypothetical protein